MSVIKITKCLPYRWLIGPGTAVLLAAPLFPASAGEKAVPFVREGNAGFVVSHIEFALPADAGETGACPSGMARNLQEIFAATPAGKRRGGESGKAYEERLEQGARKLGTGPGGEDLCLNPEVAEPDPWYHTVEGSDIPVPGLDLDGESSPEDFPGIDGGSGVDNQYYRVVGCSRSYQSAGQSNGFVIGMLTGSWGILVTLGDVDDIRNDESIEVGIYANEDPIQLSPSRDPLSFATYSPKGDSFYHARTTGRIENGVITTDPVDVQFQNEVNSMYLGRPLRDARLEATLSEDGSLKGYLAGYTPVEDMYDMQFGYRDGMKNGELAPLRLRSGSANGAAYVLGHTCHGVYHALYEHADGHPDPETGKYTSISTQYKIEAIPAFVVSPAPDSGPELVEEATK